MTNQPFIIPAILIMLFSLPLCLKLIPRNRYYGIRTALTMSDDNIWYQTNRFGGFGILISSVIYILTAKFAPYHSQGNDFIIWLLHLLAFAGPLLMTLLATAIYSKKVK